MARLPGDVRLWVGERRPRDRRAQGPRRRRRPRIEWLGRVSDEEAAGRLRGADVFCAPSLHGESFGVVLLEAMAASHADRRQRPAGYRNVARHGVDALLVAAGRRRRRWPAPLESVLADAALGRRLVAAGEPRAAEFAMDRLAERYLELYTRGRR